MRGFAARQGVTGLHQPVIGQTASVAERDDPGIVHQNKIQDRPKKIRILRAFAHIRFGYAGGPHKDGKQFVISGQPGQALQCDGLSGFLRKCQKR